MEASISVLDVLMPALVTVLLAGLAFAAQWFRMKTAALTEASKRIQEATEANRVLLEKNTVLTESIERHSNGMSEKLAQIAATSAFAAGRLKGKDDAGVTLDEGEQSELNEFEEGYGTLKLKDTDGTSIK